MSQFEKSLRKWAVEEADYYLRSLKDQDIFQLWDDVDDYLEKAQKIGMHAIANQILSNFYQEIEQPCLKCESPIEKVMLLTLSIIAEQYAESVLYKIGSIEYGFKRNALTTITIQPQADIGEYRVDFLLEWHEIAPDFAVSVKSRDGVDIPGTKTITEKLVIACDGHDFHEKTKEQAKRDKERDRNLKMCGFEVFHYTGSEIWKDPFDCANQALKFLSEKVKVHW